MILTINTTDRIIVFSTATAKSVAIESVRYLNCSHNY